MPASDITKRILADGIKDMMKTTHLSKISVGNIADHCQISRNTFYYHFKDKFDLVNWIFSTEVTAIISDIVDVTHWADGLTALCGYMQQNRGFYINALRAEGQNSFSECLMDFYQELIKSMLAEVNLELQLSSFEQEVIARFYAHAMVGIILDWARDGMKIDPNPVIGIITELINGNMFQRAVSIKNNRETPAGSV